MAIMIFTAYSGVGSRALLSQRLRLRFPLLNQFSAQGFNVLAQNALVGSFQECLRDPEALKPLFWCSRRLYPAWIVEGEEVGEVYGWLR